jgi:hypothetical protein
MKMNKIKTTKNRTIAMLLSVIMMLSITTTMPTTIVTADNEVNKIVSNSPVPAMQYVIFGTDSVRLDSRNATVGGHIYSGSDLNARNSNVNVDGMAQIVGELVKYNSNVFETLGLFQNNEVIEYPDFAQAVMDTLGDDYITNWGDFGATHVTNERSIHSPNRIQFNASTATLRGTIISDDYIRISASNALTSDGEVILYAPNGDINFHVGSADITGIVYAPNGAVNLHSSDINISGVIIAKEINIHVGKFTISENYDLALADYLLTGKLGDANFEHENIIKLNENALFPAEVLRNEDGTAYSVTGMFSEESITDANSAILALLDVETLLGIRDPLTELSHRYTYISDAIGYSSYLFDQVYNGVRVYNRTVTVVARNCGMSLSLDSNYRTIPRMSIEPTLSTDDVMARHGVNNAELVIYSFDRYENTPVLAYFCSTWDENLIVSANSGGVIARWSTVVSSSGAATPANLVKNEGTNLCSQNNVIIYTGNSDILGRWTLSDSIEAVERFAISRVQNLQLLINSNVNNIRATFPFNNANFPSSNHFGVNFLAPENNLVYADKQQTHSRDIYHFNQTYEVSYQEDGISREKDLIVYGRTMSFTVNREPIEASRGVSTATPTNIEVGEILFLHSNILNTTALQNINSTNLNIMSEDRAVANARRLLGSRVVLENIEQPVIYSWDNFATNPAIVYVFLDIEGNRTYYICAESGMILNLNNPDHQLGKGLDEGGFFVLNNNGSRSPRARELQYFPVTSTEVNGEIAFSMSTPRSCPCSNRCPNNCDCFCHNQKCVTDCITCVCADTNCNYLCCENDCVNAIPKIEARTWDRANQRPRPTAIQSSNSFFYEPEAVSAYQNAITTCEWYAKTIDHGRYEYPCVCPCPNAIANCDDNCGQPHHVICAGGCEGLCHDDNVKYFHRYASSENPDLHIRFDDLIFVVGTQSSRQGFRFDSANAPNSHINITEQLQLIYSSAVNLDTMAHEFQHGVFRVRRHSGSINDMHTSAGINEGYADLFAHFVDEHWVRHWRKFGTNNQSGASVPPNNLKLSFDAIRFGTKDVVREDGTTVEERMTEHDYISFVVYPAYLMYDNGNGLSMDKLYQLYYTSLTKGLYNEESNMNSVRTNVFKAALAMAPCNCSDPLNAHRSRSQNYILGAEDIRNIRNALDVVWYYDVNHSAFTLEVNVVDAGDTNAVFNNLRINIQGISLHNNTSTRRLVNGNTTRDIRTGWYTITVTADGYFPYEYNIHKDFVNQIITIELDKYIINDALEILKYLGGMPNIISGRVDFYDVDGDGIVGIQDVLNILKMLAGLPTGIVGNAPLVTPPTLYRPYPVGGVFTPRDDITYLILDVKTPTGLDFDFPYPQIIHPTANRRNFGIATFGSYFDGFAESVSHDTLTYFAFYEPLPANNFSVGFNITSEQFNNLSADFRLQITVANLHDNITINPISHVVLTKDQLNFNDNSGFAEFAIIEFKNGAPEVNFI